MWPLITIICVIVGVIATLAVKSLDKLYLTILVLRPDLGGTYRMQRALELIRKYKR